MLTWFFPIVAMPNFLFRVIRHFIWCSNAWRKNGARLFFCSQAGLKSIKLGAYALFSSNNGGDNFFFWEKKNEWLDKFPFAATGNRVNTSNSFWKTCSNYLSLLGIQFYSFLFYMFPFLLTTFAVVGLRSILWRGWYSPLYCVRGVVNCVWDPRVCSRRPPPYIIIPC